MSSSLIYGINVYKKMNPFIIKNVEVMPPDTKFESSKWEACHHKNVIIDLLLEETKNFECQV